ncbi:SDR family NAD(P)-dependent oxidoreductase, partial [Microbacterium sp. K35]|uniref:SDR family NAD(P)-dependent oxidoreductase n=1 Tax=Microbacterium sp. K35 TaxID=2305440 RepID=UPI00315AFBCE
MTGTTPPPFPAHRRAPGGREDHMELRLDGTTALITGAGSGIGRAVALALAAEGVRTGLLDRDASALRDTARGCV